MALSVETLLKRQKEVFEAFIASNGREVSVLPLVKKYKQEDAADGMSGMHINRALDYIRLYVNSVNITQDELDAYKRVTTLSPTLIERRGEEIVRLLVENRCRWSEVAILAKKYAEIDGRILSYPSETLKEWKKAYLQKHKDSELVAHYRKVLDLSRDRATYAYDLLLLDKIAESVDMTSAIDFIRSIKISYKSITDLLDLYKVVYPTKETEYAFIKSCIDEAFKDRSVKLKFTSNPYVAERKVERIDNFRALLEDYTTGDEEDIEPLLVDYGFTAYSFNESLKDLRFTEDKILSLLIEHYDLKVATINARRKAVLERIVGHIINGISYGQEFHRFNTYDLKVITDMSDRELLRSAYKLLNRGEANKICDFINGCKGARIFNSAQEMVENVSYGTIERMATMEEKWAVAEYMNMNNWPYSSQLFTDILARYMNNDIVLTAPLPDDEEKSYH